MLKNDIAKIILAAIFGKRRQCFEYASGFECTSILNIQGF